MRGYARPPSDANNLRFQGPSLSRFTYEHRIAKQAGFSHEKIGVKLEIGGSREIKSAEEPTIGMDTKKEREETD